MAKYWLGSLGEQDDFGVQYKDVMIDGATRMGPWANMTEESFAVYGTGKLGLGFGQKYVKQENGKWLKVEG
jgi:hypothetical protein